VDWRQWRDEAAQRLLHGPDFLRLFDRVCRSMESVDHPVLAGCALGATALDSKLVRLITFKYSNTPVLKIVLTVEPSGETTLRAQGRSYTPGEFLAGLRRGPGGQVEGTSVSARGPSGCPATPPGA
jgi:hypothetical protein